MPWALFDEVIGSANKYILKFNSAFINMPISLLPSLFLPAQRTQKSQLVLNPVAQSQISRSLDHSRTTVCQNRRTRLLQQVASTTSQGCQFGLVLFGSTGASNCINRTPPNFYFYATIAPIFFAAQNNLQLTGLETLKENCKMRFSRTAASTLHFRWSSCAKNPSALALIRSLGSVFSDHNDLYGTTWSSL